MQKHFFFFFNLLHTKPVTPSDANSKPLDTPIGEATAIGEARTSENRYVTRPCEPHCDTIPYPGIPHIQSKSRLCTAQSAAKCFAQNSAISLSI
jgi:hypothetical protein